MKTAESIYGNQNQTMFTIFYRNKKKIMFNTKIIIFQWRNGKGKRKIPYS